MASGDGDELAAVIEGRVWTLAVGSKTFADWIKGQFYTLKDKGDSPEAKTLAPSADLILQTFCSQYKISPDVLHKSQRGVFNETRNAAKCLIRRLRHDTLAEIGVRFKIKKYSSVSSIIERMKRKMESEPSLKKRIAALTERIIKSQERT